METIIYDFRGGGSESGFCGHGIVGVCMLGKNKIRVRGVKRLLPLPKKGRVTRVLRLLLQKNGGNGSIRERERVIQVRIKKFCGGRIPE